MTENYWKNEGLGKNGKSYFYLMYATPIIPLSVFAVNLYMFSGKTELPITIIIILIIFSLVFFYQTYEVVSFLNIASKTAKNISINKQGVLILRLFNNKLININSFTYTNKLGEFSKKDKVNILFPRNKTYIEIKTNNGNSYYVTRKTNDFLKLCNNLQELVTHNKSFQSDP